MCTFKILEKFGKPGKIATGLLQRQEIKKSQGKLGGFEENSGKIRNVEKIKKKLSSYIKLPGKFTPICVHCL